MLDIISFAIHYLCAILFFTLIPLPVFLRVSEVEGEAWLKKITTIYKKLLMIAHVAFIIQVVTGVVLGVQLNDWWTYAVVFIWILIGTFLGLTQKHVRLVQEALQHKETFEQPFSQAKRFSTFLTVSVIAMFILKYI